VLKEKLKDEQDKLLKKSEQKYFDILKEDSTAENCF
jgi:hypothetical protein